MLANLSVASEFVNLLNESYSESYALVSTADSDHGTCPAVTKCLESDRPAYAEPGNELNEPTPPGFILCCILVTLILFMALVDLILIAFTVVLTIFLLLKKFFGRTVENENNNDNENDPAPAQAAPFPPQEDSRSPKGDQLPNRRHRRHRRTGRPDQTSPPSQSPHSPPPAANSPPPSAPLTTPVAVLIASTLGPESPTPVVAPPAAADSKQDSSTESSDDRLHRTIVGSEFEGIGELGPCNVRFVGSQLKKVRRVCKATQQQPDSDRSERKRDENNGVTDFFAVTDPASAQYHADSGESSRVASRPQPENHHSSKSAKKRPEISVFADKSCGARCDRKVEQQPLSNQRGSVRTKVPGVTMPHRLCDLGGNSCMMAEGKGNEWLCCGIERQPGEGEEAVHRSGDCNEATSVEEVPIPSKYGSNPFEKNREQRTPVGQKRRECGMFLSGTNCEALLAIDALLEEDDDDTVEVELELDGNDSASQSPRDLQLPTELQVTGRRV